MEIMRQTGPRDTWQKLTWDQQRVLMAVFMNYAKFIWKDALSKKSNEKHAIETIASGLASCFATGHNWAKQYGWLW